MTIKKVLILIVFTVSILYLGMILAVGIHEILGHGVGAELMGHNFTKFTLLPDAMGWANFDYTHDVTRAEDIFILLAGPVSTYISAIVFLFLGIFLRKYFWWSMTFCLFGVASLLDGGPYMLWNSIIPLPPGDFGRVLAYVPEYRILFIVLGGLMTAFGICLVNISVYRSLFKWLGDYSTKRWWIIFFMFVFQLAGWMLFDWNQLAPGINYWPQISAMILTAVTLIYIGILNKKPVDVSVVTTWKVPVIYSVIIALAIFFLTLFLFSKGVVF